jgi:hypothetical protein
VEYLLATCSVALGIIKDKYEPAGFDLRLRTNEFSAPLHLKDEIESSITQVLSQSPNRTFKSIELSKDVAEQAVKHFKSIARKVHCYIMTESKCKSRCHIVPKALSSSIHVSKSLVEQSDHFQCSVNVFNRVVVANGSIEVHTGDIALQKVSWN